MTCSSAAAAVRLPRSAPRNHLLSALPAEDYARVERMLTTVPVAVGQVLHPRGVATGYVYFPNGGVCSVLTTMRDGTATEVASVGAEGVTGIQAFMDREGATATDIVVRGRATTAERMLLSAFRCELERGGALRTAVLHYSQLLYAAAMQHAACSALHPVPQRLSRWLLSTLDRIGDGPFHASHECLALTLGASRPTVTIAAGKLQSAGIIRYRHGLLTVVDRAALEAQSCECYDVIHAQYSRAHLADGPEVDSPRARFAERLLTSL